MIATIRSIAARLIAWLIFRGPVVVHTGRPQHRFIFDPRRGRLLPGIAGGAPDPDPDPDPAPDPDPEPDPAPEPDPDPKKDDPPAPDASVDEWKAYARRWERRAKDPKSKREAEKLRQERDELATKLSEREKADLSEQEKAIAKAREDAASEVTSKYETERRAERLELAVTRHASRGVKVGDGDDAKTVKFADPDDALAHLERAIKRGDIDGGDIFDDKGQVQKDALEEALAELLADKPHLGVGDTPPRPRVAGGADGGKGRRGAAKELEEMSPDDHLKEIQGR